MVRLHLDVFGCSQKCHDFGLELRYAHPLEGIGREFCLSDEGEIPVYGVDSRFVPEFIFQERGGNNH